MRKRAVEAAHKAGAEEAESLGMELGELGFGRKHPFAWVRLGGQRRKLVFSGSPRSSDDNQIDWIRQSVRRAYREMIG